MLLAVSISFAYAPWMANYTEQVESHNPALTATGLAMWGWILRITVALSFLVLPYVITTSTVLVDNQNRGRHPADHPDRAALRAQYRGVEVQCDTGAGERDRQSEDDGRDADPNSAHSPPSCRPVTAPTTC